MNVIDMSEATNDGSKRSPESALNEALEMYKNGELAGRKLLILSLDEENDEYRLSWLQAGMKMSQCVSMCEIGKSLFLSEMGYGFKHEN